nr:hypothetical protein [Streptomyces avermitilis]
MLLTAVKEAVSTPTITDLSPSSCHTPTTVTTTIARLLRTTASRPYRARARSRSLSSPDRGPP